MAATIVWFRRDLRLHDNPALRAAVERGEPVVPVYIHAPDEEGEWQPGGATKWWLHRALASLDESLRDSGSRLILRRGPSLDTLRELIHETKASHVLWNRRYEPAAIQRDTLIKTTLRNEGFTAESFNGSLLYEPGDVLSKQGEPLKVYTPFRKACLARGEPDAPLPHTGTLRSPHTWPASLPLDDLALNPRIAWDSGLRETWPVSETAAHQRLHHFASHLAVAYADDRDRPDHDGTSRLSPYLHVGQLSPRQGWHATDASTRFRMELVWREFSYHLLYHLPHLPTQPLQEKFARFPWVVDPHALHRWQRGLTGYPIVDAGMRQLWRTGWMHNRVRMIVASFLVKHLRIHWLEGARWFWDTLVDADLANNTQGWQWTAGCGADAAPYFRVFNPILQGEKFDPDGSYVRTYVPELHGVDTAHLHQPWTLAHPPAAYPAPMIDHATARQAALDAFESLRS